MNHLQRFIVLLSVMVMAVVYHPAPIFGQATLAVRGGLGWATLNDDDAKTRIGIRGGAFAAIPIQETFGFQIGGDYVQKGADISDEDIRGSLKLDYIEFSGLGHGQVCAGRWVRFRVVCSQDRWWDSMSNAPCPLPMMIYP